MSSPPPAPPHPPTPPASLTPPTAGGHLVIAASAGTGKTFQLTGRFLSLLARGERPEAMLAATFTRAAAGEILERVIKRLTEGARSAAAARALGGEIGVVLDEAACGRLLRGVLSSLDRLQVGTIDSFFARVAAGTSFPTPMMANVIEGAEEEGLRADALGEVLGGVAPGRLLELVRAAKPGKVGAAVLTVLEEMVAAAHSVLHEADGDGAWEWLEVPAGLSGAELGEAIGRLRRVSPPLTGKGEPNKNWVSALANEAKRATAGEWDEFIGKGVAEKIIAGEESYSKVRIGAEVVAAYEPLIREARSVLLGRVRQRTVAAREVARAFDGALRRLKRERGVCCFEDVPRSLRERLAAGALETLYYRLDARVSHMLLDEFQDTSLGQWRLLSPIAEEIAAHGTGERTFFCVGDAKQSIHRWREAEPRLLAEIPRLLGGGVRVEPLNVSRRSAPAVIEAVNAVFGSLGGNAAFDTEHSCDAGAARRWAGLFQEHTTALKIPGEVRLVVGPAAEDGVSAGVMAIRAGARRAAELHRREPGARIGVLLRRRHHLERLRYEVSRLGVESSGDKGSPVSDSPVVSAALSVLWLADHPGDTAARYHVGVSPLAGVVPLAPLGAAGEADRAASAVREEVMHGGLAAFVERLRGACAGELTARDARRFDQLLGLADAHDARAGGPAAESLSAFVEIARNTAVEDAGAANVRALTIHSSKGLEFDAVILPELDQRLVHPSALLVERGGRGGSAGAGGDMFGPIARVAVGVNQGTARLDGELTRMWEGARCRDVEEELSVLYVAMTRAKRVLEMIVSTPSRGDGTSIPLTFGGILRGALAPERAAEAGAVLYAGSSGAPAWGAGVAERPAPRGGEVVGGAGVRAVRDFSRVFTGEPAGAPRFASRRRASPGGALRVLPRVLETAREGARVRGELVHAWLALVEWLEDGAPTAEELVGRASRLGLGGEFDVEGAAAEFVARLSRDPLRRVLTRGEHLRGGPAGAALEVWRERGFAMPGGEGSRELLVGRFDRVVVTRAGGKPVAAHVIDFKTGAGGEAGETDMDLYAEQMDVYRRAAAAMTGLGAGRVSAEIVFAG